MIQFKNVQHAVATLFQKIKGLKAELPKVEAAIEKVESEKVVIEAVSGVAAGAVGGAPAAAATVTVENAAFAALAALDVALKAGGAAAEKQLLDAGLDQAAIDAAKAVGTQSAAVYTLVKGDK
jgi:hypothetical protein